MAEYAVHDVMYLIRLAKILEKELQKEKRLSWVKEECEILSGVRPPLEKNQPLFFNFKGSGRLDSRSLCILEAILQVRSEIAKQKDRPLFKIFSNDAVMNMTKNKPTNLSMLQSCHALSETQIMRYGHSLVETIQDALKKRDKELSVYPPEKTEHLSSGTLQRVDALKSWRDKRAKELQLEPSILFNKAIRTAIAKENPLFIKDLSMVKGIKNWQKVFFDREIVMVLRKFTDKG